jgi:peptidyl-tRNA hydrolase
MSMMTGKGKMYVVVNKDLKMSIGKTAAQVAHAVARLEMGIPYKVVVLEASTEQIHNLDTYLEQEIIPHHLYIDEGGYEVPTMSATAIAFGMFKVDEVPSYIWELKLLSKPRGWGSSSR